jgi:hypothetical protein
MFVSIVPVLLVVLIVYVAAIFLLKNQGGTPIISNYMDKLKNILSKRTNLNVLNI